MAIDLMVSGSLLEPCLGISQLAVRFFLLLCKRVLNDYLVHCLHVWGCVVWNVLFRHVRLDQVGGRTMMKLASDKDYVWLKRHHTTNMCIYVHLNKDI